MSGNVISVAGELNETVGPQSKSKPVTVQILAPNMHVNWFREIFEIQSHFKPPSFVTTKMYQIKIVCGKLRPASLYRRNLMYLVQGVWKMSNTIAGSKVQMPPDLQVLTREQLDLFVT